MARGRKPEPTALRRLRGNPGKRPLPAGEPKPASDLPEPPAFLGTIALEEWHRVVYEMHRIGVLTGVDQTVLAAYCAVYERWVTAEKGITTLTIIGAMGSLITHPNITIAHKALDTMYKYMQDLGLTPSARVKLATGVPTEGDTLDQFITAGKRKGKAA
jgi:P27 family predicted phage terminase small subunit